jgi:hypothetical protein
VDRNLLFHAFKHAVGGIALIGTKYQTNTWRGEVGWHETALIQTPPDLS